MSTQNEMPELAKEIVGTKKQFQGGVFSSRKAIKPEIFEVLDWRWSSSFIANLKNMKQKHPGIEFLIKNDKMPRSRWTRAFPARDYISDGKGGWKKESGGN